MSWVTIAAAPSTPIAASSRSLTPIRGNRPRASSTPPAMTSGKYGSIRASTTDGPGTIPSGPAIAERTMPPTTQTASASPISSHAKRSSRRRAARANRAAVDPTASKPCRAGTRTLTDHGSAIREWT